MSTEQHTFTLHGHHYAVHLHPPMEGFVIIQGLAALGLEPVAEVVSGALPAIATVAQGAASQLEVLQAAATADGRDKVSLGDVDIDLGQTLKVLLADLELGSVGGKLATAFREMDPRLVVRLLAYTNRDGKALVQAGAETLDFNAAYRGNYGELMLALVEVARRNGFFGGWATSASVETLLAKLKDSFQRVRAGSSSAQPSAG